MAPERHTDPTGSPYRVTPGVGRGGAIASEALLLVQPATDDAFSG